LRFFFLQAKPMDTAVWQDADQSKTTITAGIGSYEALDAP